MIYFYGYYAKLDYHFGEQKIKLIVNGSDIESLNTGNNYIDNLPIIDKFLSYFRYTINEGKDHPIHFVLFYSDAVLKHLKNINDEDIIEYQGTEYLNKLIINPIQKTIQKHDKRSILEYYKFNKATEYKQSYTWLRVDVRENDIRIKDQSINYIMGIEKEEIYTPKSNTDAIAIIKNITKNYKIFSTIFLKDIDSKIDSTEIRQILNNNSINYNEYSYNKETLFDKIIEPIKNAMNGLFKELPKIIGLLIAIIIILKQKRKKNAEEEE